MFRPLALVVLALLVPASRALAQSGALSVDTASREDVRQFFRAVYFASENVPMNWTGSYATGNPGDTSSAFKEATRLRINFYRALVGIPADITFNPEYSTKAQRAALMISANNTLDHYPPPTWTFFTPEGAEATASSNLAIGSAGPAAIDGYIADSGSNNAVVGHRRWLFFPQTLRMGTGDVAGSGALRPANVVWVLDTTPGGTFNSPRPATRTTETAYPSAGFVPYQLVWPRWSFSYPGADFSAATVTMMRNGQPVATVLEPLSTSPAGEPTLVWVYDGTNSNEETPHPRPAADTPYLVNVSNVRIGTTTRNFSYTVTVFDPDVVTAGTAPVVVTGSTSPAIGATTSYAINKPTFASAFDWRTLQLTVSGKTYTAENGFDGLLVASTPGYEVVQSTIVASGSAAFRLAHLNPRSDQVLQFPGTYLLSSSSTVTFQSRLAIATPSETARVQVSLDDGSSWIDVWTQTGTSATNTTAPAPTENGFVVRSVSLAAHAGRTAAIRLVYSIPPTGLAFVPEPANAVGWFVDTLSLTQVQGVNATAATRVTAGNIFDHAPGIAGAFALQARGVIAGAYPLEWGPVLPAIATGGDVSSSTSYLSNLSVRTTAGAGDNTLIVGFTLSDGSKPLLVRGIGPALTTFGVEGALTDPKLELYTSGASSTKLIENDNWLATDVATFKSVGAFNLAANSRDAALVASLAPTSYTAQLSGIGGSTGLALVELYDTAAGTSTARLTNVSARSQVGTGDNILVAGFTIAGTGPRNLLIRAVGPTLTAFGVGGVLEDPKLELFDATRPDSPIAINDNWEPSSAATFPRVGAFSLTPNSGDAVLLITLPPGSYTAQVSGVGNTTGVALVEVYEAP